MSSASPPRRLPPLLRSAWFGLNQTFRRRIAYLGLTPNQYTVLRWLTENQPSGLTQRDLTTLMASDPNTIVATLQRMEAAGWIARQIHPADRRKHQIHIRPPGSRIYAKARVHALALQADVLALIPPADQPQFLEHLARIAAYCNP